MSRLAERVAVITGSSRGIGRATAELFAAHGAQVVVCCHEQSAQAAELVERLGRDRATAVTADVGSPDGARRIVDAALSAFGRLDILVNNAGILVRDSMRKATVADWSATLDANVVGSWLVAREAAEHLTAAGGSVVNVSSIFGLVGSPSALSYSASKGAVLALTTALARELAPRVRVNAVAPGNVLTELTETAGPAATAAFDRDTLLGRSAAPAEIAHAILFLASDEAGYITGQTLVVDGGYTVR